MDEIIEKKSKSDHLRQAKNAKNDEFYTLNKDIEAEILDNDYVEHFRGKTILCPCDDPEYSAFFKFFINFPQKLGFKKLIATHYNKDGSPSYKLEWAGEVINGDTVNLIKTPLKENGDFRSEEIQNIMKEYGTELIVVTNPPFSLFREFVSQIMEYGNKFVIMGNNNAVAYKEIFPLLKEGKIFMGHGCNKTCMYRVPDNYKYDGILTNEINDGHHYCKVPAISWYTNLDLKKNHVPLSLNKNYKGNEDNYPKYDNYDAINCDKVADIPKDYYGVIGVPITYLAQHCPEQFDILGQTTGRKEFEKASWPAKRYVDPIQHNPNGTVANGSKANTRATLVTRNQDNIYYTASNCPYELAICYARILIQRIKENEENIEN